MVHELKLFQFSFKTFLEVTVYKFCITFRSVSFEHRHNLFFWIIKSIPSKFEFISISNVLMSALIVKKIIISFHAVTEQLLCKFSLHGKNV